MPILHLTHTSNYPTSVSDYIKNITHNFLGSNTNITYISIQIISIVGPKSAKKVPKMCHWKVLKSANISSLYTESSSARRQPWLRCCFWFLVLWFCFCIEWVQPIIWSYMMLWICTLYTNTCYIRASIKLRIYYKP